MENGAFPAAVNNEGQTPLDLAEDFDDISELLQLEIDRLGMFFIRGGNDFTCICVGIDLEDVKCEEERVMLEDAKAMRNNPNIKPLTSPGGATPLHVAAAKNYTTVLE